jgi:diguanylate cyclase (GGDEF)-like protein
MKIRETALWGTALVAVFCGLAWTGFKVSNDKAHELVEQSAKNESVSWARFFEANLPGLDQIVAGKSVSDDAKKLLQHHLNNGNVYRFKLFSSEGKLVLDTKNLDKTATAAGAAALNDHNAIAAQVLVSGLPLTELQDKVIDGRDALVAETYLPLKKDGKIIGVAETYVERTRMREEFGDAFTSIGLFAALLAGLGFAVPAFGFYLRTSQKLKAETEVRFLANHDTLTGLVNRRQFNEEIQTRFEKDQSAGLMTAIHFVDLDYFKDMNDQFGHAIGDEVLKAVAERLKTVSRANDLVARFGGDEFIVAQFGLNKIEEAQLCGQQIVDVFKDIVDINGRQLAITASVGSAISPTHANKPDVLMHCADTAAYVSKSRGRNCVSMFEPGFNDIQRRRQKVETWLRAANQHENFELHFQPLFHVEGQILSGFEALLRMRDDEGNFVSPAEFIPVSEEIGMIDEIGQWVLQEACKFAKSWPAHLRVSVNLSAVQFKRKSVVLAVTKALSDSGLDGNQLVLEVTESVLLHDAPMVLEQLKDLKNLGVAIAMDDFGSGYSSLGYMLKFPFDHIKIDRSFVNELSQNSNNARKVVETIIALGHTMKMQVTAEGVETAEQAEILRNLDCDSAQGYLFGRPVPPAEVANVIMKSYAAKVATPRMSKADARLLRTITG